ncbi:unnamed protein product [Parnassius apollo]|uniref:(apollo) hypothetical protein n=1 Tax=Parnassius apollo TaxID=110799 RepID=A0A8S3WLX3_PARAO|nr:unnamed protein product [Parnassius apollo]
MAPKKRVDQLNKDGEGTTGKKGPKKKIIKLKAPTSIRVEVPAKATKNTKARVVTTQKLKSSNANGAKKSKARIVTTKNLSKNEIKIMLANEVVQAHFSKKPIIPNKPLVPIVKRKPARKKVQNKGTCDVKEAKPVVITAIDSDVVQADVSKKPVVPNKPLKPIVKRKPARKKLLNKEETSDVKEAKPVIITAIDSDGSAFETLEPKTKKKSLKGLQRKNVASTNTVTIGNNVKDGPVKRSYVTKRGLNAKIWKRTAQNTEKLEQVEHKPRKKIRKGKISANVPANDENVTTTLNENNKESDKHKESLNVETGSDIHPALIETRKTSAGSELSWTKDISSSSTTTCVTVCSKDFVRFDNKLPIIKLTHFTNKLEMGNSVDEKGESLTDKESADEECNKGSEKERSVSPAAVSESPSLSLSSYSSSSSSSDSDSNGSIVLEEKVDKIGEAVDKLTSHLKKFDLEIMTWIGYEDESVSPVTQNFNDKIYRLLKEESQVILHCQNIKRVLLGDDTNLISEANVCENKENSDEDAKKEGFIKPDRINKTKCDKTVHNNNDLACIKDIEDNKIRDPTEEVENEDALVISIDDRCNDDDDALSLFAESITGFESSRKNSSIASISNLNNSESNEYIPQPIRPILNKPVEIVTYFPTKISKQSQKEVEPQPIRPVLNKPVETVTYIPKKIGKQSQIEAIPQPIRPILNKPVETVTYFPTKISKQSQIEAIPQPIRPVLNKPVETVTYFPTKISKQSEKKVEVQNNKAIMVCEKQNADSTSIYRNSKSDKNNIIHCDLGGTSNLQIFHEDNKKSHSSFNTITKIINPHQGPALMASIYKPIHGVKSVVFEGVCFFNLINSCKKSRCRFLHAYLDNDKIKSRLTKLSEDVFIQEYMLIRNWAVLRRQYGIFFVLEGIRRELTRIVVEMAIDFVLKTNHNSKEDATLQLEVIETVLLYLNTIDISIVADLLTFNVKNGEFLCDIFMQTLAETQNFSRFKIVFINLTKLIHTIPRPFSLNVATSLLERVCILPYEKPLVLALLKIIEGTSPEILQNKMISHLEKQLSFESEELYEKLQAIKHRIADDDHLLHDRATTSSLINYDLDPLQINSTLHNMEIDKRLSPDTTNLDNLNKIIKEPIITRTINTNRIWSFGQNKRSSYNSPNVSISSNGNEFLKLQCGGYKDYQHLNVAWTNIGYLTETVLLNTHEDLDPISCNMSKSTYGLLSPSIVRHKSRSAIHIIALQRPHYEIDLNLFRGADGVDNLLDIFYFCTMTILFLCSERIGQTFLPIQSTNGHRPSLIDAMLIGVVLFSSTSEVSSAIIPRYKAAV